jgi:hypothetical protein
MRNPFRYFNSSPEVIRLTVMMYIRYPLSLRQVEDLLFERGIDICHEDGAALVEPVRSAVCRRDPKAPHSAPVIFELALAPGRGFCQDKWRDLLSVARGSTFLLCRLALGFAGIARPHSIS